MHRIFEWHLIFLLEFLADSCRLLPMSAMHQLLLDVIWSKIMMNSFKIQEQNLKDSNAYHYQKFKILTL